MNKLLHICSSPRGERSYSRRLADIFIHSYLRNHPTFVPEVLDLWKMDLPEFDCVAANARYDFRGEGLDPDEQQTWRRVERFFKQFASADKYVISAPMWNFLFPYKLKQYIDIITQPGMCFEYLEDGTVQGKITGKPVMLILTRGGIYSDENGKAFDFQRQYLYSYLRFIGFTDIRELVAEGQDINEEIAEKNRQQAEEEALVSALNF
ncbi:MAG: FMN-dependent NADH-azoreductase [Lentisphaerae bacterium]|nr:FMN-dependent NADH-azoreductase [Lentisphaerota bacterium]MCP4101934.1 FMN-dependent NADH-azoreductase [Lentisphaerota bacterium]